MQQINPTGFRLGTVGWKVPSNQKSRYDASFRVISILKRELARRGLFLINAYNYSHRGMAFVVIIFYRFYQRSRMEHWVAKRLRRREGSVAPVLSRFFTLQNLNIYNAVNSIERRIELWKVMPKIEAKQKRKWVPRAKWLSMTPQQRQVYNNKSSSLITSKLPKYLIDKNLIGRKKRKFDKLIGKLGYRVRGWVDLEWKIYNVHRAFPADNFGRQLREIAFSDLGRSEAQLYNVLQLTSSVNPLIASRYYIFKRFSSLMFQNDLIETVYLAAKRNISALMAHSIMLGLERVANKRQQRRFLKMVQATVDRVATWDSLRANPLICRISIYGKLDAKMRRAHVEVGKGTTRFQQLDWNTSYYKQLSKTKFGTSTIHVWLRNLGSRRPNHLIRS
jgi:hypothetical protein